MQVGAHSTSRVTPTRPPRTIMSRSENPPNDTIVPLNVGGVRFVTTLGTLRKYPDSFLGAMFSGRHRNLKKDETGAVFLDRDPMLFGIVLQFLRNGVCACLCPHGVCNKGRAALPQSLLSLYTRRQSLDKMGEGDRGWKRGPKLSNQAFFFCLRPQSVGSLPSLKPPICSTKHTGVLQLPPPAETSTASTGHAPFSAEQLTAELDYLCIPVEEHKEWHQLQLHRAREALVQATLQEHDNLLNLATFIVGSVIPAGLPKGLHCVYLLDGARDELSDDDSSDDSGDEKMSRGRG